MLTTNNRINPASQIQTGFQLILYVRPNLHDDTADLVSIIKQSGLTRLEGVSDYYVNLSKDSRTGLQEGSVTGGQTSDYGTSKS